MMFCPVCGKKIEEGPKAFVFNTWYRVGTCECGTKVTGAYTEDGKLGHVMVEVRKDGE